MLHRDIWWIPRRAEIARALKATAFGPEQFNFRVRDDTAALNTDAGWLAAINVDPPAQGTGTANRFRIRFTIDEQNNKTGTITPQLEVSKNSAAFADVTATSANVQATASTQYADNDVCSTELFSANPPAAGTFDSALGTADEVDGALASQSYDKEEYCEIEFCVYIVDADVSNNDTLDLRIRDSDASPDTIVYTQVPRITVSKAAPSTTPYYYRELIGYPTS